MTSSDSCNPDRRDGVGGQPDVERLMHDLEVHQAELETQNAELRAAQIFLQQTRDRYYDLFHHAPVGYVVLDEHGRIIDVNQTWCEWCGEYRDQLINSFFDRLLDPASAQEYDSRFKAIFKAPQGKDLQLRLRTRPITFAFTARKVHDAPAHQDHLMATLTDVTARIETEKQLKLLQQFEAIGRLTGGVAHDFNNILSSVMGFARLARERLVSDSVEKIHHYLASIENSGKRGRKLVRQLLTYTQGDALINARDVALPTLVEDTREMLRQVLPATMNLDLHIDRSVPLVKVDPLHVEQVLTNLVINARDAGHGRAHVAIDLRELEVNGQTCAVCMEPIHGTWICLEVRDQGPGMDSTIIDHIFEPFFTTKKSGEGSGMGLSVVSGIARSYDGHMLVESSPNEGSSFRWLLRASDTARTDRIDSLPAEPVPHWAASGPVSGSKFPPRILVVDDEEPIRELLTEFMTDSGYVVIEAADAILATSILADPEIVVDAVITDQTMPGMTGLELAELIKSRTPGLPVILCTGYSEAANPDAIDSLPVDAVLIKPIDPDEIDAVLCRLLEEANTRRKTNRASA